MFSKLLGALLFLSKVVCGNSSAPPSFTDGPPEVEIEWKVTNEKEEEKGEKSGGGKEELPSDSHYFDPYDLGPSNAIVPTLIELSETDETGDKTNKTLSPGSPDQQNFSEAIKVSVISVVGFSLLCLSMVVAL
ncbi:hypothetical protein AAHC03_026999 [Spirometra sp. Aus1]